MNAALEILLYCAVIFGMGIFFVRLYTAQQRRREREAYEELRRNHPERVFGTEAYLNRFYEPQFQDLEEFMDRPFPATLRRVYEDGQQLRSVVHVNVPPEVTGPVNRHPALHFFPADGWAVEDLWPDDDIGMDDIPFATDGAGGMYYVKLTSEQDDDPPVYVFLAEGNHHYRLADRLSEFLSWRAVAAPTS